ncbi:hypothetical protein [Bradyrhizobium sp. Mp27]|uniref:hypothetical protein n=1 Tax=Bradyrhizobium sp. Mp27 TaxID=3042157 RepID=UPI00248D242D|nr:hypothetical protein [Bradyrhizobium sp. Mp27]MDI2076062.1 hypothetical protein [Bradyrhizobium sp. Mp27]
MGILSDAWRAVKGAVRWVVKAATTLVTWAANIFDFLFGFLNWPPKNLTLHIVILSKYDPIDMKIVPMCQPSDLQPSIDQAERILRERFNVKLRPYAPQYAQVLGGVAPEAALKPSCCGADPFGQEFLEQGEWYAGHTAGWVAAIPTSLRFPITAFVVEDVQCKSGCAIGPLTDYLVIDMDGVNSTGPRLNNSTLMHEIGHCCHLWHFNGVTNLMWRNSDRGDGTKWWQRNLFRNSRHVTYW